MPASIVGAFEEDRLTLIGGPELPSPEIHFLGAAFGALLGDRRFRWMVLALLLPTPSQVFRFLLLLQPLLVLAQIQHIVPDLGDS